MHSEAAEKINIVKKKFYDAAHNPFAYRIGINENVFKSSDDGEPSGTAGKPILEAIDKHNLTDTLVVVTRYFGGTKLGTGGLRRAFFEAADNCLTESEKIEKIITEKFEIIFDYEYLSKVMHLFESENVKLLKNLSEDACKLIVDVRLNKIGNFQSSLIEVTNGKVTINKKS